MTEKKWPAREAGLVLLTDESLKRREGHTEFFCELDSDLLPVPPAGIG